MQRSFGIAILAVLLMAVSAISVYGQQVPVDITEVKLDNVELEQSFAGFNRLDVDRGQEVTVEVQLEAFANQDNVQLTAFVSGYEYNDVEPMSVSSHVFRVQEGVKYVKKLKITIPNQVDVDEYKLRIMITDRNNFEQSQTYDLKIDTKRHDLKVKDILLFPEADVKTGTALLARVRLENYGQKNENDVKVSVRIPELSASAVDYINEIRASHEEETEEMYIKLPCAKPGEYVARIDVSYDNGHQSLSSSRPVHVTEGDLCKQTASPTASTTQVVAQPPITQVNVTALPEPQPKSMLRNALEIILLVLVSLLVIVGLVIGFTRMNDENA